jgi:DNA-binding MarR family transcriptional regulator
MYSIDMNEARTPTPGFLVWRLSMKWRVAVDRAVAPLGLTHAQYSVLSSLFGMVRAGERPSQRRLADHTGLEPIYISKLVRALEAAGLVERTADPTDTRAVRLALTDAGTDVAERAIAVVRDLQDELTAPLGGIRGGRTRNLVHELQALLAAPSPPTNTGDDK